jgi:chromosome segregation ATPase
VAIQQSSTNLREATKRLDAAVDALEDLLKSQLTEEDEGETLGSLRERIRLLTEERDQLLLELETLRVRTRRLESANDEVAGRLDVLMTSIGDHASAQ